MSVRDIAKEVGVRESTLYRHFKSKQDIWDNIIVVMKDRITSAYKENQVPEAAKQYDNIYLSGAIHRQGKVFEKLIQGSFFKDENPEVIAMEFYGPILLMFQQYDCNPENEEQIKNNLYRHVKAFGKNYRRDKI